MVFGEIEEPLSRALWNDDVVECYRSRGPSKAIKWDEAPPITIEKVDAIFIGETNRVVTLLHCSMTNSKQPTCTLLDGKVSIYRTDSNFYVVTYVEGQDVPMGEITRKLTPWLEAAESVYVLTSASFALFQSADRAVFDSSPCIIRQLSNTNIHKASYRTLEIPNMITSLSASIFSYCTHAHLKCALFISFFDGAPLDSRSAGPFLKLLKELGVNLANNYIIEKRTSSDNLYL